MLCCTLEDGSARAARRTGESREISGLRITLEMSNIAALAPSFTWGGGYTGGGYMGGGGGDVGWFVGVCEGGWVGGGGVVLPWGVGLIPRPRVEARSEADRRTADRIGGGGGGRQAGTVCVG